MQEQQELFQAETSWFAVLKSMMDSGDAATMGGTTFLVYCVIKAHSNYSTGTAFPSIELIAEKAGISEPQVNRCINKLIEMEYIKKEKRGRSNIYRLREKVELQDPEGNKVALATWDYVPGALKASMADLKNVLMTGDLAGAIIIHIEKLTIQNVHCDNNMTINLEAIDDPELREAMTSLYNRFKDGGKGFPQTRATGKKSNHG